MIPSLVSFPDFDAFEAALRQHYELPGASLFPEQADQIVEAARILFRNGLPPIPNATAFALLFGVSPRLISSMALMPTRYWRAFRLEKRTGGYRLIAAPRVFLKTLQRFILNNILISVGEFPHAYGFSRGKSIFLNAANHVKHPFVWNTDLANFFPSISHHRVREVFAQLGFDSNMSVVLASLCTFRGYLPQGAPTSPKLSNIIFRPLDEQLSAVSLKFGMTYSRYADDLTFSGNECPQEDFISECDSILTQSYFTRNLKKTRLHGPQRARFVTGLVVNEKVQPDRKTRRWLRAVFHSVEKDGGVNPTELHKLRGWASYVHAYDSHLGKRYIQISYSAPESELMPLRFSRNRADKPSA